LSRAISSRSSVSMMFMAWFLSFVSERDVA